MAIVQCPQCGGTLSDKAPRCPKCGYESSVNNVVVENQEPKNRFNWGAAGLWPLWGFANGMWWLIFVGVAISWLPLGLNIPAGILASIYMGVKGNELARRYKQWRNDSHFVSIQKNWQVVGVIFFILNMVSYIVMYINIMQTTQRMYDYGYLF